MNEKFLVVSSVTLAIRGKSELDKYGIKSKIEKIRDYRTGNGCAFGIRVFSGDVRVCMKILRSIQIRPLRITDCTQNVL